MVMRAHLLRAGIYLLLLISPVGAPLVGLLLSACPTDLSLTPDGPFALPFSYCGLYRPIEHFYQKAIFLPFLPGLLLLSDAGDRKSVV
jgi:hypothetical protein